MVRYLVFLALAGVLLLSSCLFDQKRKTSVADDYNTTDGSLYYEECPSSESLPEGCSCDDSSGLVVYTCEDCNSMQYDEELCTCEDGVVTCNNNPEDSEDPEVVANPIFSPVGSTYTSAQTVTITSTTPNATIRYNKGYPLSSVSDPSCSSGTVGSSVAVSSSTAIKAIACVTGQTPSSVRSKTYIINIPANRVFKYQGDAGWLDPVITGQTSYLFASSGKLSSDNKSDIFIMSKGLLGNLFSPNGFISDGTSFAKHSSPGAGINVGSQLDMSSINKVLVGNFSNNSLNTVALLGSKSGGLFGMDKYPVIFTKAVNGSVWPGFVLGYTTSNPSYEDLIDTTFRGAVVGKFDDGNNLDDIVIAKGLYASTLQFWAFYANTSTPNTFNDPVLLGCTSGCGLTVNNVRELVSGDFNNDGKTDIAGVYYVNSTQSKIYVWLNNGAGGVSASTNGWWAGSAYANNMAGRVVSGDFNKDGKLDIATVFNEGNPTECGSITPRTKILVWFNTGSAFNDPVSWWSSGCSGYDANKLMGVVSGDYNGDGYTDISGFYNYGTNLKLHVWISDLE